MGTFQGLNLCGVTRLYVNAIFSNENELKKR